MPPYIQKVKNNSLLSKSVLNSKKKLEVMDEHYVSVYRQKREQQQLINELMEPEEAYFN